MIVVKIELWPSGVRAQAREIGRIVIANDGKGSQVQGSYDAALSHAGRYSGKPGAWKGGRVAGFDRGSSPCHLVRMAIDACLRSVAGRRHHELVDCTRDGAQTPGEIVMGGVDPAAGPAQAPRVQDGLFGRGTEYR